MAMTRWLAPAALAAALGAAALAPAPARAQNADIARIIVDVADVIMRGGQPYYRHGAYGPNDRLVMGRDRYGNPVYYRVGGDRGYGYDRYSRSGPPYGRAYGYHGQAPGQRKHCDSRGRCTVRYYDPRHDRTRGYNRYGSDRYGYDRYRYGRGGYYGRGW